MSSSVISSRDWSHFERLLKAFSRTCTSVCASLRANLLLLVWFTIKPVKPKLTPHKRKYNACALLNTFSPFSENNFCFGLAAETRSWNPSVSFWLPPSAAPDSKLLSIGVPAASDPGRLPTLAWNYLIIFIFIIDYNCFEFPILNLPNPIYMHVNSLIRN